MLVSIIYISVGKDKQKSEYNQINAEFIMSYISYLGELKHSHTGKVIFPHWEKNIPRLGI